MYITKSTIVGLEETATYPIVLGVLQDVKALLGLSDTVPLRIGENPPLLLSKGPNGVIQHTPDVVDEELFVTYTETSGEDYDVSLSSIAGVSNYIYNDPEILTTIKPLLSRKTLVFNITYLAKSKSKVASVLNKLRVLGPSDTRNMLHDLEYSYYIPEILIELVDVFNTLKNTHTIPIVDLDDYVANTFNSSTVIINSETGNPLKSKLAVRNKQQSVIGTIDSDVYTMEKDKDDDSNRWAFSIDYSIEYELPNQLLVTYPITIYNQLIPAKFRFKTPSIGKYHGNRVLGEDGLAKLTTREAPIFRIPETSYYLRIPEEDTLLLPIPEQYYVRLFSVIAVIDTIDLSTLFYLDELPNMAFKTDVLELIKLEASRIGTTYTSIFYIDIFNHNNRLYTHKVIATIVTENINGVMTERVKLSADSPLDIRGSYRISFNILTDLTVLHHGCLALLKDNIATVDAGTAVTFSVIDSVIGVLNLDISKLRSGFTITDNTTSIDIALNIRNDLWHRMFTKQTTAILTEMLTNK